MNFGTYINFVFALIFVLALIGVVSWGWRRFASGGALVPRGRRHARLDVVELRPIDARHRLALIRRDGVEHLILLGVGGDLVIETNIDAPQRAGVPAEPE